MRAVLFLIFCLLVASVPAGADEAFYRGKTLRIIVGAPPGGGYDTYTRALARHLGRHIPGAPTVVVDNMAGAGTLVAANHTYRVARPDGLTMVNFSGTFILGQILGLPGIEFDARKFEWIGIPAKDHVVCAFTRASGITSVEAWMAAKTPVKVGATGRGSAPEDSVRILQTAVGLPTKIVSGYKGTADVRLAADAGEVAGGCWQWESMKVNWRSGLDSGDVVIVLQATATPLPDLPKVPLALSLAKTDEARALIRLGIQEQGTVTRVYAFPPGTPKDRVQALRQAFLATLADSEFRAEAVKAKLDVDPVGGEETERLVADLFKLDPALIARLRTILLP